MSKYHSYIDKHTKRRYRLKKYVVTFFFLTVLAGGFSDYTVFYEDHLKYTLSTTLTQGQAWISDMVAWYRSAAFVDENLFIDYSGVFPDLNELARQEMVWLMHMWGFWGGGVGLGLPLVFFLLFQVTKRLSDRMRKAPSLKEHDKSTYLDIQQQIKQAYWRANNHNFEKAIFLISLLGILLFSIQFLFQPFVIIPHHLLISVLISFLIYTVLVYFFYLFLHRFDYSRVIRIIDREMDLRHSLVTALDKDRDYSTSSLYLYLLEETQKKVRGRSVLSLFPFKFPYFSRRNVGMTTSFLAAMIFVISLALPAVALVYDNLLQEIFSLTQKEKNIEQIILDQSDQIRLLSEGVEKEESKESMLLALELSDLSHKLNDIVQSGVDVEDVSAPDLKLAEKLKVEEEQLKDEEKNKEKKDSESKSKILKEDEEIITNQTMNVFLNAQINSLIKDLIRYNLRNSNRKLEVPLQPPQDIPMDQLSTSMALSSSDQASSGPVTQPKGSSIQNLQNDVPDAVMKDTKKLKKIAMKIHDLKDLLNRLYQKTSKQLSQDSQSDQPRAGGKSNKSRAQSRLEKLSEENRNPQSDVSSSDSPGSTPSTDDQQDNVSGTVPAQNIETTPREPGREEHKSKDDTKNDSQRRGVEAGDGDKIKAEIIHPHDIEFVSEELLGVAEDMDIWEHGWEEENHSFGHIPFRRRMRLNSELLKKLSDKLVTITMPENIIGIPPGAVKPVVAIENPDDIQSLVGKAKNKKIVDPANIRAVSTDLRLVANDLDSMEEQVNQIVQGRRGLSGLQAGYRGRKPIISQTENPDWTVENLTDRDASDNRSDNIHRARLNRQRPNLDLEGQNPEAAREGNLDSDMLQPSLQGGVLQNYRFGVNPESGLRYVRNSDNWALRDSGVREIIDGLENLRSKVKNTEDSIPSDQTSGNVPSAPSGNLVDQIEGISEMIQRERNPENLSNLSGKLAMMVQEVRNQILDRSFDGQSGGEVEPGLNQLLENIDQTAQQLLNEQNSANQQKLSNDLIRQIKDYQIQARNIPANQVPPSGNNQQRSELQQELNLVSEQIRQQTDPERFRDLGKDLARLSQRMRDQALRRGTPTKPPAAAMLQNPAYGLMRQEFNRLEEQMRSEQDPARLQDLSAELSQLINRSEGLLNLKTQSPSDGGSLRDQQRTTPPDRGTQGLAEQRNLPYEHNPPNMGETARRSPQPTGRYPVPPNSSPGRNSDASDNHMRADIGRLEQRMRTKTGPRNLSHLSGAPLQRMREFHGQIPGGQMAQQPQGASNTDGQDGSPSRDRNLRLNRQLATQADQIPDISQQMQNEQKNLDRLQGEQLARRNQLRQEARRDQDRHLLDLSGDGTQTPGQLDRELGDMRMRREVPAQDRRDIANQMNQRIQNALGQIRGDGQLPRDEELRGNQQLAHLGDQIQDLNQQMQNEQNNLDRLQGDILARLNQFRQEARMDQDRHLLDLSGDGTQTLGQLDRELGDMRMRQGGGGQNRRDLADQMSQSAQQIVDRNTRDGSLPSDLTRNLGEDQRLISMQRQDSDPSFRMLNEQNPQNLDVFEDDLFNRAQEFNQQTQNPPHPSFSAVGDNTRLMAQFDRDQGELPHQIPPELDQTDQRNLLNLTSPPIEKIANQVSQSGRLNGQSPRDLGQNQQLGLLGREKLTRQMQMDISPDNLNRLQNDVVDRLRLFQEQVQTVSNPVRSTQSGRSLDSKSNRADQQNNQLPDRIDQQQNQDDRTNLTGRPANRIPDSQNQETGLQSPAQANSRNRPSIFPPNEIQTLANQMRQQQGQENIEDIRNDVLKRSRQFQDQAFKDETDPNRQTDRQTQRDAGLIERSRRLNEQLRREQNIDQVRMLSDQLASMLQDIPDHTSNRDKRLSDRQLTDGISDRMQNMRQDRDHQSQEGQDSRMDFQPRNMSNREQSGPDTGLDNLPYSRPVTDPTLGRLSRELAQQSDPDRIRDLNNEISQIAQQQQDQERMLKQNERSLDLRNDLLGRMRRLSDQVRAEKDPARLRKLKDRLADNLQQLQKQQDISPDRRLDQLSRDLRQQSDPDRIRDLNNEISQVAQRQEQQDQDRMLKQNEQGLDLHARNDLVGRMRRLSDQVRAEEDPIKLRKLKDRLADNLQQLQNQQDISPDRRLDQLSRDLRQQSDPDRIRDIGNEISRMAQRQQQQDQDRMLQGLQISEAGDNLTDQSSHLPDHIGQEKGPTELRNLKDRLADSLHRMKDRYRTDQIKPVEQQPAAEFKQDLKEQRGKDQTISPMDDTRLSQPVVNSGIGRVDSLSNRMRIEEDPKAIRKLQQEMVDITEQVLNRLIPLKQAPKVSEDPLLGVEAINNRIQSLASKLPGDQQLDQMKDTANQLSDLSREMLEKMASADLSGKEPTALPKMQQQESHKLTSSIDDLMSRIQKAENPDSIVEDSRQLAKLAKQMKHFNREMEPSYQRETSRRSQQIDPARQDLIDTSLRVQWLSHKLQKGNDPETNQSYQKQLVKLNKQMTDSMKKVLQDVPASSSDDTLQTQQEKEISTQVLQLSRRLKKVDDSAELVEISKRMDQLANQLLTRKENRRTPSNSYRGRSNEDRSLARRRDRDLNQKTAFHKVSQTDDAKYLGREPQGKAALAIKKIEKTIEKLKAYNSSDSSLWKNSNTAPKGKSSIGSGSSQRPLPLANRFLAEKVAKETNRTPDKGPIRNVLPMKRNLYSDDVFERVIRRLEDHKKRIKKSGEDNDVVVKNVLLKDYSDIKESRKLSRQPTGLENVRYEEREPEAGHIKKVEDKTVTEKTVSYMEKNQLFLSSRLKELDEEIMEMIPERKIKTEKNKNARLSSSLVSDDSVIANTIPPDYQSIFKRLFSNDIDFNNEL